MSRRPVVLHFLGAADDGGGIVSVVRALAGTNRFDCLLGMSPGAIQRRQPALPQMDCPPVQPETIGPANLLLTWRAARAARRWLADDPARIVHGHTRAGLLVALWLARWGETRVVASVHCYGRQRWFYRWAARQLGERLYWLSPAMREYYGIAGAGWSQCRPGGVPPAGVSASPTDPDRLRLGGCGSVVAWKRWDLVLAALAQLTPAERARVTFTHIGDGPAPARQALAEAVQRAGLGAAVRFLGPQPSSDGLLAEIDALVVASEREPFSMAMLEALAAGVPVLAADSGGARDVIRPDVNGRLFRSGDAPALAGAIRQWLRDPPATTPAAVRETAIRAEAIAEQWHRVYAELIGD